LGIHPNSAALFYRKLREIIIADLVEIFPEHGAFEVDESYFGGVRKGKHVRSSAGSKPAKLPFVDLMGTYEAHVQKSQDAKSPITH
jgi:hypothetical protein